MVAGVSYRYAQASLVHMGHIECSASRHRYPPFIDRPVSTFSAFRKSLASPETPLWSAHGRVDQPSPALWCARLMSSSEDCPFWSVCGQRPTCPGSVPLGVGVREGWRFGRAF